MTTALPGSQGCTSLPPMTMPCGVLSLFPGLRVAQQQGPPFARVPFVCAQHQAETLLGTLSR